MKLYLVNRKTNIPYEIDIPGVGVLGRAPSLGELSRETILVINAIFSKFKLPLLEVKNARYPLSNDQVLALIISSSVPVEEDGATAYRDMSEPFPKNQAWWHLDNSDFNADQGWKRLNCKLVSDCYTKASLLINGLQSLNSILNSECQQFIKNCTYILKLIQPYHTLLPTPEMLHEGKAVLYSDHLPQLFRVGQINCLTWNILHPALASGYAPFNDASLIDNTKEKTGTELNQANVEKIKLRAGFISDSLVVMGKKQQLHIITLQESFLDATQLQELCSRLGGKWECKFNSENPRAVILFDNNCLQFQQVLATEFILTVYLHYSNDSKDIILHNVHFKHQELPFDTEAETLRLLHCITAIPGTKSIVIGDFNSRIPPINLEQRLIVTGVTPKYFRDAAVQGCDWTDACFTLDNNESKPSQIDGETIHPITGEKFQDNNCTPVSYQHVTLAQQIELRRLRPSMDITEQYKTLSIQGYLLEEMEAQLRNTLEDPTLKIRLAVNAYNQRGFVIVSKAPVNYREHFPRDIVTYTDEKSNTEFTIMCCGHDKFNEFYNWVLRLKTAKIKYSSGFFSTSIFQSDTSIPENLLSLSCFDNFLPEKPNGVDTMRKLKEQIRSFTSRGSEFTKLCAKLVLANYFLHFTEYDTNERNNMGNPKIPLLRPSHFLFAMSEYINMCALFAKVSVNAFTPLQRQIIKENLIELGKNILVVYATFNATLSKQVELFENRDSEESRPKVRGLEAVVSTTVKDIRKTCKQVFTCQNLLLANGERSSDNNAAVSSVEVSAEEKAACNGARNLSTVKDKFEHPPINLVKSFLSMIYPVQNVAVSEVRL